MLCLRACSLCREFGRERLASDHSTGFQLCSFMRIGSALVGWYSDEERSRERSFSNSLPSPEWDLLEKSRIVSVGAAGGSKIRTEATTLLLFALLLSILAGRKKNKKKKRRERGLSLLTERNNRILILGKEKGNSEVWQVPSSPEDKKGSEIGEEDEMDREESDRGVWYPTRREYYNKFRMRRSAKSGSRIRPQGALFGPFPSYHDWKRTEGGSREVKDKRKERRRGKEKGSEKGKIELKSTKGRDQRRKEKCCRTNGGILFI